MYFLSRGATTMPIFSAASIFSAYASLTALFTLIQQFYHQFVPEQVRAYISNTLKQWFTKSTSPTSSLFTLVIEQYDDGDYNLDNQVYHACDAYLGSKLKSTSNRLKVCRKKQKYPLSFKLAQGEKYSEYFEEVNFQWSFNCSNPPDDEASTSRPGNKYFELSVNPNQKHKVFNSYLPFVLQFYDEMIQKKKKLELYSHDPSGLSSGWRSVNFEHPFTFDSLALEPEYKKTIIDDLDRFMRRREFYKKIGRAWKRGYLLYGPPGTGKSSLIAAMANYLKFDIYDLQLSCVRSDSMLRKLLLTTTNKSILVIEDIDCSLGSAVSQRHHGVTDSSDEEYDKDINNNDKGSQISLSGLLNFIDGLWASCGDERIIILTTNYKDRLDPALLRPGRMDMHIHMSYLTMPGFRVLASNYLNISEHHLYVEIEELIQVTKVTPAQVAEELIRSDDADIALSSLVKMLKGKLAEQNPKDKTRSVKWTNGKDENGHGVSSDDVDVVTDEHSSE